jgi:predicted dehydrogenase
MSRPRLGFLGVGWIGRARLEAVAAADVAQIAAVADVVPAAAEAAAAAVGARVVAPADLLDGRPDLDGVVIATPSALHAEQAVHALDNSLAVYCQKPLGRDATECRKVLDAAQRADRLLGVDMCYRELTATARVRELIASGELGEIYAAELMFHNAYGPDKAWYTDPALSAGGCVIDLGIHLVDLALWLLDRPGVTGVTSRLLARDRPVEDYAVARLDLDSGATVSIGCSWFLPAGTDAVISATFYGSNGAASLSNVDGSFYDFAAYHNVGTARTVLAEPPDDWGGRATVRWARALAEGRRYDADAEQYVDVAAVLDRIYGR